MKHFKRLGTVWKMKHHFTICKLINMLAPKRNLKHKNRGINLKMKQPLILLKFLYPFSSIVIHLYGRRPGYYRPHDVHGKLLINVRKNSFLWFLHKNYATIFQEEDISM